MNNLEFMGKYNLEKLEIGKLSVEELTAYILAKRESIELARIQIQAAEHSLREKGESVKMKVHSESLSYVPPAEIQRDKLFKSLEKQGMSGQKIADIKTKLASINFDDI